MPLISVYFLLSVTMLPRFADADKIYRISLSSADESPFPVRQGIVAGVAMAALLLAGFGVTLRRIQRLS